MVVFDEEGVILYDAKTGVEKDQIAKPKSLQHLDFDSSSYTAGKFNFKCRGAGWGVRETGWKREWRVTS